MAKFSPGQLVEVTALPTTKKGKKKRPKFTQGFVPVDDKDPKKWAWDRDGLKIGSIVLIVTRFVDYKNKSWYDVICHGRVIRVSESKVKGLTNATA